MGPLQGGPGGGFRTPFLVAGGCFYIHVLVHSVLCYDSFLSVLCYSCIFLCEGEDRGLAPKSGPPKVGSETPDPRGLTPPGPPRNNIGVTTSGHPPGTPPGPPSRTPPGDPPGTPPGPPKVPRTQKRRDFPWVGRRSRGSPGGSGTPPGGSRRGVRTPFLTPGGHIFLYTFFGLYKILGSLVLVSYVLCIFPM